MVESRLEELEGNSDLQVKELTRTLHLLKLKIIKNQQQILSQRIKQAEQDKLQPRVSELSQKFAELTALRMKYESQI